MGNNFAFINADVIFPNLIERMLKVVLDVVKANKNETIQNRHHIFKMGGKIMKSACKIWPVNDWKNINENFAISAKGYGSSVSMNDLQVIKSDRHFAHILADTGYFPTLNAIIPELHC